MNVGAVILSRLDSTRLPGKALRLVHGRPLLDYVIELCRLIDGVSVIVLATSDRTVDDPIAEFAEKANVHCVRGSVENVAGRFLSAMEQFELDAALRVNGDSPLNDPKLLSSGVEIIKSGNYDLVTNVPDRTYPFGMSLEVVLRETMRKAYASFRDAGCFEHVTKYFYDHPQCFRIRKILSDCPAFAGVQLSVDRIEDLMRFSWVVEQLNGSPSSCSPEQVVHLMRQCPDFRDAK